MAFPPPKARHMVSRTKPKCNRKCNNSDLVEYHTKELYILELPKRKTQNTRKFHPMFQSSANPCIIHYLRFLNSCLRQIANLATK